LDEKALKALSKIKTIDTTNAKPLLKVPESDGAFFYTAGRLLSYFPEVNQHGMTFFREDCQPILSKLQGALVNVEHIKPGNGVDDPMHLVNATIGSIYQYEDHPAGIDIVAKNDRQVVKALGFNEDQFSPGDGLYANFSQESDFIPRDASFIVVDKNDRTKVIDDIPFAQGQEHGISGWSKFNVRTQKWDNYNVNGNPVYLRLRPWAFSGAGHVMSPADPTGQVYSYAASQDAGLKMLSSFMPSMDSDDIEPLQSDTGTTSLVPAPGPRFGGADHAMTLSEHPDLITTSTKDYSSEDDSPAHPADHFAAVYQDAEGNKRKALRIKNDKGELHRGRLVAAYHSLAGMRGNTHVGKKLPQNVAAHAMAVVRQGLELTKPQKEISMSTDLNPNITKELEQITQLRDKAQAELDTKGKALSAAESANEALTREFTAFKDETEKTVASMKQAIADKDTVIAERDASLAEHAAKALSSERLSKLEALLPYAEDEKAAPEFAEFSKSLASMSEDRFELQVVRRELAREKAVQKPLNGKALASASVSQGVEPVGNISDLHAQLNITAPTAII
jgi:hypothetical protein